MRYKIAAALLLVMVMCAGCGGRAQEPVGTPEGMESVLPDSVLVVDSGPDAPATPVPVPEDDVDYENLIHIAKSIYNQSVSTMHNKLGDPVSTITGPSCQGKGTDSSYTYKNIIVYTYSEGSENVIAVSVVDSNGEEVFCLPAETPVP